MHVLVLAYNPIGPNHPFFVLTWWWWWWSAYYCFLCYFSFFIF